MPARLRSSELCTTNTSQAGAEVLETNSFGANRAKLAQYGLESQVAELNRRAAAVGARSRR